MIETSKHQPLSILVDCRRGDHLFGYCRTSEVKFYRQLEYSHCVLRPRALHQALRKSDDVSQLPEVHRNRSSGAAERITIAARMKVGSGQYHVVAREGCASLCP